MDRKMFEAFAVRLGAKASRRRWQHAHSTVRAAITTQEDAQEEAQALGVSRIATDHDHRHVGQRTCRTVGHLAIGALAELGTMALPDGWGTAADTPMMP